MESPRATVARFNVTPVKGTALTHPETVSLTEAGIPENRRFFLVDADGSLVNGSTFGPLVQVRTALEQGELTCTFPSGDVVAGTIEGSGGGIVVDFYGRSVAGHEVGGPFSEAFSSHLGRAVRLVRADRDGDGADVWPLTIVGIASVADLGRRGGYAGELDARRFRINIELDGIKPFEEDTWDGRSIAIGDAVVQVHGQIPRCVVTTQDPETGLHDWNTLKQIASFRPQMPNRQGIPFGMYARVQRPGHATVEGPVAPVDRF
jgi:uncharacterized protein YcbX